MIGLKIFMKMTECNENKLILQKLFYSFYLKFFSFYEHLRW
jgi:hypothetical protein